MATKARKPKRVTRKGDDKAIANGTPGTKAADKKAQKESGKTRIRKTKAPGK